MTPHASRRGPVPGDQDVALEPHAGRLGHPHRPAAGGREPTLSRGEDLSGGLGVSAEVPSRDSRRHADLGGSSASRAAGGTGREGAPGGHQAGPVATPVRPAAGRSGVGMKSPGEVRPRGSRLRSSVGKESGRVPTRHLWGQAGVVAGDAGNQPPAPPCRDIVGLGLGLLHVFALHLLDEGFDLAEGHKASCGTRPPAGGVARWSVTRAKSSP
jgi:hypothetical protein